MKEAPLETTHSGPLAGIRVIEVAGVGPGPFCAMMLADMGADVVRIERAGAPPPIMPINPAANVLHRGRRITTLNLKEQDNVAALLDLCGRADVLLEGYRPGVMERMGLGPEVCHARNPALIYARMTGWGQTGPMAHLAGHDINYFAMSGALWMCGREGEVPLPNLNMVSDMGGGGMLMAFGIAVALVERGRSGRGQVIDAAMVEGTSLLAAMIHGYRAMDRWSGGRGENLLDGGAHFYDVYATLDGEYMAVGSIEPQFYAALLDGLGLDPATLPKQHDRAAWPTLKARFKAIFAERTQADWTAVFSGRDACVTPVLRPEDAIAHPMAQARDAFATVAGIVQPAPAPRFSRTPGKIAGAPPTDQVTLSTILDGWADTVN